MITSIEQWVSFLHRADSLLGLPLCVVGIALGIGGWRLWQGAAVATFALIAGGLGVLVGGEPRDQLILGVGFGVMAGGIAFLMIKHAIPALGGLIAAGIGYAALTGLEMQGAPLWISVVLLFGAAAAISHTYRRQVTAIITSFEGAALLVSGLIAVVADSPHIFHFFRTIARNYWFFIPFLLLVPTVVGSLLQLADARQRDAGMVAP